jgi:hypothetical protein
MSNFKKFHSVLIPSCIALNMSRFQRTKQGQKLFIEATAIVNSIFSSLSDIQDIMTGELLYLENESTFSEPDTEKSFADAITSYHYAIDILKIITNEPQMYVKYCVPACLYVKTNDKAGIPKDAFLNALASHRTRLQNNKRSHGVAKEERVILNSRLENITKAFKLYKALQQQVLGL